MPGEWLIDFSVRAGEYCMDVCVYVKCVGENLDLCSLTTYLKKHAIKGTKMQETNVILEKK